MSSPDAEAEDDYNHPDPGWVKKSTGMWEYQGPPGMEDTWKDYNEKSCEQIQKEEEEWERQCVEEVRRLKAIGAIPEDFYGVDMDGNEVEWMCPGCGKGGF
jgi:hypothetical protein